jgi:DNA-directed RNA polymerase subunit beta
MKGESMPHVVKFGKRERLSFAKTPEILDLPNLIEIQKTSYEEFLQQHIAPDKRESTGLQAVFSEVFPITDFSETSSLEFVSYSLGASKYDIGECQSRGFTYAIPIKVRVRLVLRRQDRDTGDRQVLGITESDVYMGEIPRMTENGTFIINGSERVIVSQLHRSPGATFGEDIHATSGQKLFNAKIIPYRGAYMEFESDIKDLIHVRLDRRKKMLASILLRGLGWETDEQILKLFAKTEQLDLSELTPENMSGFEGRVVAAPVVNVETGEVLIEANVELTEEHLEKLDEAEIDTIEVLDVKDAEKIEYMRNTLDRDLQSEYKEGHIEAQALVEIFRRLQPGDPPTVESARNRFEKLFFDPVRYDLSRVGRYKLNGKLGKLSVYSCNGSHADSADEANFPDESVGVLRREDIAAALLYLMDLQNGDGEIDDIDHLGNRRVRAVGELLQNQVRVGLLRVARAARERMTSHELETATPPDLINPKPLTASINDFFGSSQLSQFMQQTNPLDELTHKRRLSALGPGGLHRERATFQVRDVHRTHYGRVCPIETPEGPSVGLIVSLSTYARVNPYGFLETPYRKAIDGVATNQVDYLTADGEDTFIVAQANSELDNQNRLTAEQVVTRSKGEYPRIPPEQVDYIDISPKQIVGVSAALIPFLEHDDANRALMGSNMQRQAVPLIRPEAPRVGTGMEFKAARDSGAVVLAKRDGVVESLSSSEIIVRTDDAFHVNDGEQSFSEMGYDVYQLINFKRSNSGTSIHQRPCVFVGDEVKEGQVIADGTSTESGELALGSNILVAFMSWEGYNFEDAILISESLVTEDTFTSIHIDEFEVDARDTKMGLEEITRDIPNLSDEALSQLDDEGIIRVGSVVSPGSILVGKVTPKGESDLGPEEKLLRAIFGEKVGEVRDASTYASPGVEGVVIDVKVYSRKEREKDRQTELREVAKEKAVEKEAESKQALINQRRSEEIRATLLGKVLSHPVDDGESQVAQAGDTVTQELLDSGIPLGQFQVTDDEAMDRIQRIRQLAQGRIEALTEERDAQLEKIRKGDELKPGVIKLVKVYVASRRKIAVGDKMAGRHGNKGVVAKILPAEDMPYLEDGTPIDIVLNPLGVPSRMNVGQILETHLGWAVHNLGLHIATPVFDGATEEEIQELLVKAGLPSSGKTRLYDGRTGESFKQDVTVGYAYLLKLNHLVDDKIHARSTGPYSLVTQQPLGGKAQQGGQRFGEMEVWALEAYGAAYTLQELLTIKSDDVSGRSKIYEVIVKGQNPPPPGTPESFNVLVKELQSLCLNVNLESRAELPSGTESPPTMPWVTDQSVSED